jgi:Flp pilus assembly protein TadG
MRNLTGSAMRREDGQTLLMFVLFMVVLFAFVGLAVDLGFAYLTRAQLSKGVDAAALAGMRSVASPQAGLIATNAFFANYGTSARDVAPPSVQVAFNKVNGNTVINVKATVTINTFFVRVLPALGQANWNTLTVGESAQATRTTLVLALVLDRSGSMTGNGGAQALPPAVTNFIAQFDDTTDYAAQISFSSAASVDVPMTEPFISKIQTAAIALEGNFNGDTCSDEGLTNGMAQIEVETNVTAQSVTRVMVFFTDGMANSFNYVLNCGARDIGYNGPSLFDPTTGAINNSGCTVPPFLSSINPSNGVFTANAVDANGTNQTSCIAMHNEAENRAERIANLARSQGYVIYCVGMGTPCSNCGECQNYFPVLNQAFLEDLANTTDSQTYNAAQPVGDFAIATDSSQLSEVFQTIASKILLRLSQ